MSTDSAGRRELPAFWDVVRGHMDEAGIRDLEELHRRFLGTEWAERIPVPGRHRGTKPKLPEFRRHVTGEYPIIYGELVNGLLEVFEIERRDARAGRLALAYVWGPPLRGVHPQTPMA